MSSLTQPTNPTRRGRPGVHQLLGHLLRRTGGALGARRLREVVDASYFAPGQVARHIPKVWRTTTPEAAIAARQAGCVKALRRILGDRVGTPAFARAAELLIKAATSPPFEGRPSHPRRAARDPGPRRRGGPLVSCRLLAARAPWRRAHRGPDDRGCRRPLGSRPVRPRHGHAGGEVRTHPPPPGSATRRRDRRDARSRPDRDDGWLSEPGRAVKAGRGAYQRPRGEALPEPRAGRAR